MDLIASLTSQLGISADQAQGATGALLGLIKKEVPSQDFEALSTRVPESAGWMKMAEGLVGSPADAAPGIGGMLGGGGMLGSALGALGGGAGGTLGAIASLLPMLQKLNLNQNVLAQLAPIVITFLQQRMGGDALGKLTQGSPILGQLASMAGGGGGAGGVAGMLGKLF